MSEAPQGLDRPPMPNNPASKKGGNFFTNETAGVPNWVWGLVIVAGLGLAFVVPKLFGGGGSTVQSADTTGATDNTGLGGGSLAGGGIADPSAQLNQIQTDIGSILDNLNKTGGNNGSGTGGPPGAKYVTVTAYPKPDSTLADIAKHYGVSLQRIEELNPTLAKNYKHLNAGDQVRIS